MSYEPKVQVVRLSKPGFPCWRYLMDDEHPQPGDGYLVTEAPMPGQRVVGISGRAFTVEGLANPMVVLDDGGVEYARVLHPYDPDEALVERVSAAMDAASDQSTAGLARAAIAAMREADNA